VLNHKAKEDNLMNKHETGAPDNPRDRLAIIDQRIARMRARLLRRCLGCSEMFESEWAGERICQRCKGSARWRSGTPPEWNAYEAC
jgi:hypothetical protein